MPTGWTLNCSLVPAASSWSAYSLETIEAKSIGKVARMVASGRLSTNFTVMSSTLTISLSELAIVELKYSQAMPGAYSYHGPVLSNWRMKVKTTSSAFISRVGVNQSVVWNFTPGPQVEGDLGAVLRDLPALGEAGLGLGRALLELDQPVIDRPRRGVERRPGRPGRRVEALRRALAAIDQRLGLARRRPRAGSSRLPRAASGSVSCVFPPGWRRMLSARGCRARSVPALGPEMRIPRHGRSIRLCYWAWKVR